jgi:hypothetical protein
LHDQAKGSPLSVVRTAGSTFVGFPTGNGASVAIPLAAARCVRVAGRAGLSERPLARLIVDQTSMSFGRWRQQLNIMLAPQRRPKGASIQQTG